MNGRRAVRLVLLTVALLLVQSTLGLDLTVAGAHPDLMWLLPVTAALVAGPQAGAIVGFAAGLCTDLFLPTPFGLSALVGCLLGFVVGQATAGTDRSVWWLAPVAALAGSAGAVMLYAVLGAVLGQDQFLRVDLPAIVGVVAVTNAVLALPVQRAMRWALVAGRPSRRRVETVAGGRW